MQVGGTEPAALRNVPIKSVSRLDVRLLLQVTHICASWRQQRQARQTCTSMPSALWKSARELPPLATLCPATWRLCGMLALAACPAQLLRYSPWPTLFRGNDAHVMALAAFPGNLLNRLAGKRSLGLVPGPVTKMHLPPCQNAFAPL